MQLAQGWSVSLERGPDWLFITLRCEEHTPAEPTDLAANLWELAQCHRVHRIVLDLHELSNLNSALLGELALLGKRVHNANGILRVCNVPAHGEESIRAAKLDRLFPCYSDRGSAVRGEWPRQPR